LISGASLNLQKTSVKKIQMIDLGKSCADFDSLKLLEPTPSDWGRSVLAAPPAGIAAGFAKLGNSKGSELSDTFSLSDIVLHLIC
jgi:hypothetical protein